MKDKTVNKYVLTLLLSLLVGSTVVQGQPASEGVQTEGAEIRNGPLETTELLFEKGGFTDTDNRFLQQADTANAPGKAAAIIPIAAREKWTAGAAPKSVQALSSAPAVTQLNYDLLANSVNDGTDGKTTGSEVVVEEKRVSDYREEDRIGNYEQPRWTTHRRFPSTRIYVRPEGSAEAEFWVITKDKKSGPTTTITQTEFEVGLPHRLQLDFYLITRRSSEDHQTFFDQAAEVRYAFANWGKIFGNPTLYFEYILQDEASDKYELKFLLGDELAPGWHWGLNFVWEQEITDAEETALELTAGLSRTIFDEKFSLGIEGKFEWANEKGERDTWHKNFRIGPSLQWLPMKNLHIDVAMIFGITKESRRADTFVVIGWEF